MQDGKDLGYTVTLDGVPVPFPVAYVKKGNQIKIKVSYPPGFLENGNLDREYWAAVSKRVYPQTTQAFALGRPVA
jgi:hypothetical protein